MMPQGTGQDGASQLRILAAKVEHRQAQQVMLLVHMLTDLAGLSNSH